MTFTGSPSTVVRVPVLLVASIEIRNSLRFSDDATLSGASIGTSTSYVDGSNVSISDTVRSAKSVERAEVIPMLGIRGISYCMP